MVGDVVRGAELELEERVRSGLGSGVGPDLGVKKGGGAGTSQGGESEGNNIELTTHRNYSVVY
jgi:hypothetical protein